MSILINDTDMPKSCMECICLEAFDDEIYGRQHFCALLGIDAMAREHSRHKKCPLSEIPTPHGRLIDADELMKVIEANDYTLQSYYNTTDRGMFTIGIKQAIDEAPTIIEAEE